MNTGKIQLNLITKKIIKKGNNVEFTDNWLDINMVSVQFTHFPLPPKAVLEAFQWDTHFCCTFPPTKKPIGYHWPDHLKDRGGISFVNQHSS